MENKTTNQNTVWHEPSVHREDRERMNGHKSCILWFTGLSGSGKSTLAHAVEDYLHKQKIRTFVLDGDNVRRGLCKDLGFSQADRTENIRRIGELSNLLMQAGIITIVAFISPFVRDRQMVRQLVKPEDFVEIFCDAALDVCEARDVKGLYKKARAGLIPDFTGISSPYERPENPELTLDTSRLAIDQCVLRIMDYLNTHGKLNLQNRH
jgi:adenylylsulfate kinase